MQMDLLDDSHFANRKEFRLYDKINFRLKQEILLRDDEIKRLKKRLENLKYSKLKSQNKFYTQNNQNSDDNIILNERLESLKNQIFREKSKAEMRMTNLSIQHSQKISQMNHQFEKQIQELKQTLYDQTLSNNYERSRSIKDDSVQVEEFIQSLQNIIHSRKNDYKFQKDLENDQYENIELHEDPRSIKIDDKIYSNSKFYDLHLYNEEIQDNEQRIQQIRRLIKKYQNGSISSLQYSLSGTLSHDAKNNYNTEISLNESSFSNSSSFVLDNSKSIQTQAKIQKLLDQHKKQVEILQRKIKKEKKNGLLIQRKIEMAASQSFITDAEIAETIKVQEKIKKKKEKKDSLKITIESLSEMTIQQREEVYKRLKIENITLKREIARVDSVAYGRTGKYQYWKKLDDEALFQCTMLFFQ